MDKIIKLDATRQNIKKVGLQKTSPCDHKQVIAYTYYRTVRCSICGQELDPFAVLVDMLKAYAGPEGIDPEEKRLLREVEKRKGKGSSEKD